MDVGTVDSTLFRERLHSPRGGEEVKSTETYSFVLGDGKWRLGGDRSKPATEVEFTHEAYSVERRRRQRVG